MKPPTHLRTSAGTTKRSTEGLRARSKIEAVVRGRTDRWIFLFYINIDASDVGQEHEETTVCLFAFYYNIVSEY